MKLSVLIPTYRRPDSLAACLRALASQTRAPDEVVLVIRESDSETRDALPSLSRLGLPTRTVLVQASGLVAALNEGLATIAGDAVAMTDDDACPRPDWLARIEAHFLGAPSIGAVGGRDRLYRGGRLIDGRSARIGVVQWFGRQIQQHHLGSGPARAVDFLKGCNMAFRCDAVGRLRFDARLRGAGAQVYSDTAFCLAVRRAGWKVVYDPSLVVDHFEAERFDADQRDSLFDHAVVRNSAHNETLTMLEHLGALRRSVFLLYALGFGSRGSPGVMHLPRLVWLRERHILTRWGAALEGRMLGLQTYLEQRA